MESNHKSPYNLDERVSKICEAVVGLRWYEWSKVATAIEKKFSSASSKVALADAEELKKAIELEF